MKIRAHTILIGMLLAMLALGGTHAYAADAYNQDFAGWPNSFSRQDITRNGWHLEDGYSHMNAMIIPFFFPKSPHPEDNFDRAVWLADIDASTVSSMTTPQLGYGIGTITFWANNFAAGANDFVLQLSTNGTSWSTLTSYQHTISGWLQYQHAVNTYVPGYLRILKTGDSGGGAQGQMLGLDDITITKPPAYLGFKEVRTEPEHPVVEEPAEIMCQLDPYSDASTFAVTSYWRIGDSGPWTALTMEQEGLATNYSFVSASSIPAQGKDDMLLQYYITAHFTGTSPKTPTNYPTAGASDPIAAVYRQPGFMSYYTNLYVTGSFNTNLILIDHYVRQCVVRVDTNVVNAPFQYWATNINGITSWGETDQPYTNLPVFGLAETNGGNIVLGGTNTGNFVFRFNETVDEYSAHKCDYTDFDSWTGTAGVYGTHTNNNDGGWVMINGMTTGDGYTNKAFVNESCVLNESGEQPFLYSPFLSNGVGEISFWYRNWEADGMTPTAFYVEMTADKQGGWTRLAAVTNIITLDYVHFSLYVSDMTNYYVRIVHATNSTRARLCVDQMVIANPGPGIGFSNISQVPASPTILDTVSVKINTTNWMHATDLQVTLWYRYGTTGSFEYAAMTNTSGILFEPVDPIPRWPVGTMQYYIKCSFQGMSSVNRITAYYPLLGADDPIQYAIENTSLVQTFSGWPNSFFVSDITRNAWHLEDGYSHMNAMIIPFFFPKSPHPDDNFDRCVWLADRDDSVNSYLSTPYIAAGAGVVSFSADNFTAGANDFLLQTSSDGLVWSSVQAYTQTTDSWDPYEYVINNYNVTYLRIFKNGDSGGGDQGQMLGLDDITISYAPAEVGIDNVMIHPGYPSEDESVKVSCIVSSLHPLFLARGISCELYYRKKGETAFSGPIKMTADDGYFLSETSIPGQAAQTIMEYYIESTFHGYYNEARENHSPTFYPAGTTGTSTNQYYLAPTSIPASYLVRPHLSSYDRLEVTGSFNSVTMELFDDNVWQGILNVIEPAGQISFAFEAFSEYTNMANAYDSDTPSWGDPNQVRFSLPMASVPQAVDSNIVANVGADFRGQVVFRYDTVNNFYTVMRGAYQNFNEWDASTDYFEETLGLSRIIGSTNDFDHWTTNKIYITNTDAQDLGDFDACTVTNVYYTNATFVEFGWMVSNAIIIAQNHDKACQLKDSAGEGATWPHMATLTDGLKTFGFDYRARLDDHYHAWYDLGAGWSNYYLQAYLQATNISPDFAYLSMFARYQDSNDYYEYRLEQKSLSPAQLMVSLIRHVDGDQTTVRTSEWFNASLLSPHLCQFIVATNNSGYLYLEGSVDGIRRAYGTYAYDTNGACNTPGSIGFLTRGADILVDDVSVAHIDVQRFEWWTESAYGTYTNNDWVIREALPNSDYCRLQKIDSSESRTDIMNFDSWAGAGSWGTHVNGNWKLNDGYVVSSHGAASTPNAAWLTHDSTNAYLEYLAGKVDTLSFRCKNVGTEQIGLKIQTSGDGLSDWLTVHTITNVTDLDYSYKLKLTFSGYTNTAPLTNFPALIVFNTDIANFSYAQFAATNGCDLRFADATESMELNYEIEKWDATSNSYVWVQLPLLNGPTDYIYAYWGSGTMAEPPAYTEDGSVWSESYVGVWHMSESNAQDSTANEHHGVAQGVMTNTADGKVDGANIFTYNTGRIFVNDSTDFTLSGDYSVSAWIKAYDHTPGYSSILGTYNGRGFMFERHSNNRLYFWASGWVNSGDGDGLVPAFAWRHVAFTRNGTAGRFYINGALVGETSSAKPIADGTHLYLGAGYSYRWDGMIDEVRISKAKRSRDWMWASWLNTASNDTFVGAGTVAAGSGSLSPWRYYAGIKIGSPRHVRILKAETTANGEWLGIDNVTVSRPTIPSITSPRLDYDPGTLKFYYRRLDGAGAELAVYASTDGVQWEGPIDVLAAFGTSSTTYDRSTGLGGYRYMRIENHSDSADARIEDIYITEGTNVYYEQFSASVASNWNDTAARWRVDDWGRYARYGYAGPLVGFDIQMAITNSFDPEAETVDWLTVDSYTATNLEYKYVEYDFEFWDRIHARVKHTAGDASLVVDDISLSSWRGTNYTDSNGWRIAHGWIDERDTSNNCVQFWISKGNTNEEQYLRSPWLTNGIGTMSFDFKVVNPPVTFDIQSTVSNTTDYVTVDTVTFTNSAWGSYSLTLNQPVYRMWTTGMYVRILHTTSNDLSMLPFDTNKESILMLDKVKLRDYAERDNTMWYAYNALITHGSARIDVESKEFEPYYEPEADVRTCYLNNKSNNDVRVGVIFTNDMAFVQSPRMSYGIGEVAFWYRSWDGVPATIRVASAPKETTPLSQWSNLVVLSNISHVDYRYFTTNFYITEDRYLRIYCSNAPLGRVCLDNVLVGEPIGADFEIADITLIPTVPLYTNTVKARVQLTAFLLDPTDIQMRLYYNVGTNSWAQWPEDVNYVSMIMTSNDVLTRTYEFPVDAHIDTKDIDTVVQYHIKCTFGGTFAEKASPKWQKTFTNPSWYYPVDHNYDRPYTNPYYVVFSCSTGMAWINEINYGYVFASLNNEYVETCAKAGVNISNWSVQLVKADYSVYGNYSIPVASVPDEKDGFGFWVVGDTGVTGKDSAITNIPISGNQHIAHVGGIRLVRSMGAYEHSVSYGAGGDTLQGFEYAGKKTSVVADSPLFMSGTGTTSRAFSWYYYTTAGYLTPNAVNVAQKLSVDAEQEGNDVPPSVTIEITGFWCTRTNVWIVSTGTNTWIPTIWYSTNLHDTSAWASATALHTYSDGVYTQWLDTMTNASTYYYKIMATTNSP